MRLRSSIIGLSLLFFVVQLQGQSGLADSIQRIHLWLHQYVKTSAEGSSWPVIPGDSGGRIGLDLYSGIPGIVLFYLEAHHATNRPEYLEEAKNGANFLLARLPEQLGEMDLQSNEGQKIQRGFSTGPQIVAQCRRHPG
jgi:Lanthionine synthetase C-like protein